MKLIIFFIFIFNILFISFHIFADDSLIEKQEISCDEYYGTYVMLNLKSVLLKKNLNAYNEKKHELSKGKNNLASTLKQKYLVLDQFNAIDCDNFILDFLKDTLNPYVKCLKDYKLRNDSGDIMEMLNTSLNITNDGRYDDLPNNHPKDIKKCPEQQKADTKNWKKNAVSLMKELNKGINEDSCKKVVSKLQAAFNKSRDLLSDCFRK